MTDKKKDWQCGVCGAGMCACATECPVSLCHKHACMWLELIENPTSPVDRDEHGKLKPDVADAMVEALRADAADAMVESLRAKAGRRCGSRTWVTPDEMVTCEREAGHANAHQADTSSGFAGWSESACCFEFGESEHVWSSSRARSLVDRLQRQLAALGPDAAANEGCLCLERWCPRCAPLVARDAKPITTKKLVKATTGPAFTPDVKGDKSTEVTDPIPPDDPGEWTLDHVVFIPETDNDYPWMIWYWSRPC